MAIKVRCEQCRKKISVDEAFAGGVCRCPYCKAINFVGGTAGGAAHGARPAAPPSACPESPPTTQPAPGEQELAEEHIPMANPVKLQGIVTIVLLVALLGMFIGAVVLVIEATKKPAKPPDDIANGPPDGLTKGGGQTNGRPKGPTVGGVEIVPPVIYCLDGGSSMTDVFDYARLMTRISATSLKTSQQYNVLILSDETGDLFLRAGLLNGGMQSQPVLDKFLDAYVPIGTADVTRGLSKALEKGPGTIVLMSRKNVDGAMHLGEGAKARGIRIVTIAMTTDGDVPKSMKRLAEASGGGSKAYSEGALEDWAAEHATLE